MGNATSHSNDNVKCTPVEVTNKCVLDSSHFKEMCKTAAQTEENYTFSYYQSKTKDARNEDNGNVQNIDIKMTCEVSNDLAKELCVVNSTQ